MIFTLPRKECANLPWECLQKVRRRKRKRKAGNNVDVNHSPGTLQMPTLQQGIRIACAFGEAP